MFVGRGREASERFTWSLSRGLEPPLVLPPSGSIFPPDALGARIGLDLFFSRLSPKALRWPQIQTARGGRACRQLCLSKLRATAGLSDLIVLVLDGAAVRDGIQQ